MSTHIVELLEKLAAPFVLLHPSLGEMLAARLLRHDLLQAIVDEVAKGLLLDRIRLRSLVLEEREDLLCVV